MTQSETEVPLPPLVGEFHALLNRSVFRSLGAPVFDLAKEHGDAYTSDFERYLQLLREAFPDREWPQWSVNGYVALNKAILKEEMEFRKTGEYTAAPEDLERVTEEVYDNEDVMDRFYLVGLFCSYFLWPHHYRILDYYRREFLQTAPAPARFMEWGVGHGMLSLEALRQWGDAQATLIDLSKYSLSFADHIFEAGKVKDRTSNILGDVLELSDLGQVDRLVCSELLEHVPDPDGLLQRVHDALTPGGITYLTAAINAPQPDHVFLFKNDQQLFDMVAKHGLTMQSHLTVCHPDREKDEDPPTVVAMVAQRAE